MASSTRCGSSWSPISPCPLDNVLAVAGASHGNMTLLIFGLGLSIPLVVFASGMLSTLMDKYPIIIYIGSMILGRVGAEMILTDPALVDKIHFNEYVHWATQLAAALAVLGIALYLLKQKKRTKDPSAWTDPTN